MKRELMTDSSKRRERTMPGRAIQGKYLGSVRRQREQGKSVGKSFIVVSMGKNGRGR